MIYSPSPISDTSAEQRTRDVDASTSLPPEGSIKYDDLARA